MNIKQVLQKEHSKVVAEAVARYAEANLENFQQLMEVFLSGHKPEAQRAAWSVGKLGEKKPGWLMDYLPQLLTQLKTSIHPAVSRNIYRSLQFAAIPEKYHAPVFDLCLRDLHTPDTPVAIKVFAMTVASNIAKQHSELIVELRLIIEENLAAGASAGFISRARKILAQVS